MIYRIAFYVFWRERKAGAFDNGGNNSRDVKLDVNSRELQVTGAEDA